MFALLNVHLTGGKPLWQELVGPLFIAATAIIAAGIAARTANKRQAQQLAHDRELQAERLAYDREQRNRQHTRETVNDAVNGMNTMIKAISDYKRIVVKFEEAGGLIQTIGALDAPLGVKQGSDLVAKRRRRKEAAYEAVVGMASDRLRLTVVLGATHAVVTGYGKVTDAATAQLKLLDVADPKLIDETAIDAATQSINDGSIAFLRACRAWSTEA